MYVYESVRMRRAVRIARAEGEPQEAWRADEGAQEALRTGITFVLEQLYTRHSEVPYIAAFCKEVGCAGKIRARLCSSMPVQLQGVRKRQNYICPAVGSGQDLCSHAMWLRTMSCPRIMQKAPCLLFIICSDSWQPDDCCEQGLGLMLWHITLIWKPCLGRCHECRKNLASCGQSVQPCFSR